VTVERLGGLDATNIRRAFTVMVNNPRATGRMASVSVVPLGAHPTYFPPWRDLKEFPGYFEDEEMVEEHRKRSTNRKRSTPGSKNWILDCPTHEDYLRKVGMARIRAIKDEARVDLDEFRLPLILDKVSTNMEYNDREMMIVAGSRIIREAVLHRDRKVIPVRRGPRRAGGIFSLLPV